MPDITEYPISSVRVGDVPNIRFSSPRPSDFGADLGRSLTNTGLRLERHRVVKQENYDQRVGRERYLEYADSASQYKLNDVDKKFLGDAVGLEEPAAEWSVKQQGELKFENPRQQAIFSQLAQRHDVTWMNSIRRHEQEETIKAEAQTATSTMGKGAQMWTDNPGDMIAWMDMHASVLENLGAAMPGADQDTMDLAYRQFISKQTRLGLELLAVTRPSMARQFLDQNTVYGTVRENMTAGDLTLLEKTLKNEGDLALSTQKSQFYFSQWQNSQEQEGLGSDEALSMEDLRQMAEEDPELAANPDALRAAVRMTKERVNSYQEEENWGRNQNFLTVYDDVRDRIFAQDREENPVDIAWQAVRDLENPTPAQVNSLLKLATAGPISNEALTQEHLRMAWQRPDAFIKLNPVEWEGKVSKSQSKRISDAQMKVRSRQDPFSKAYGRGIDEIDKATKDADLTAVQSEAVKNIFQEWWEQETKHAGRVPAQQDIDNQINRIIATGVLEDGGFFWFDKDVRFFEMLRDREPDQSVLDALEGFTFTAGSDREYMRITPAIEQEVLERVNAIQRQAGVREAGSLTKEETQAFLYQMIAGELRR